MSATSFLRHRRAVAFDYIQQVLGSHPKRVATILREYNLEVNDLETLRHNTDVLSIADQLAADKLDEPELDSLETLDTITTGDRAAVHSPDVRRDQFRPLLQHPSQETVGVGNMHDHAGNAAEEIANVGKAAVDEHGSLAAAAAAKVDAEQSDDALANHGDLPAAAPSPEPAANQPAAGEPQEPMPPAPTGEVAAETLVDREAAAEHLEQRQDQEEQLEKLGEEALSAFDHDQLVAYATRHKIEIQYGPRTANTTIVRQIVKAQETR